MYPSALESCVAKAFQMVSKEDRVGANLSCSFGALLWQEIQRRLKKQITLAYRMVCYPDVCVAT